jgi:hypothetical protein
MFRRAPAFLVLMTAAAVFASIGCESINGPTLPGTEVLLYPSEHRRQTEEHRRKFQTDQDPRSIDWLLSHVVRNGMTLDEVNQIIGCQGEPEYSGQWLLAKGKSYRADDRPYKWGPDSEGRTVYLVFREGYLTNFNPEDFDSGPMN